MHLFEVERKMGKTQKPKTILLESRKIIAILGFYIRNLEDRYKRTEEITYCLNILPDRTQKSLQRSTHALEFGHNPQ